MKSIPLPVKLAVAWLWVAVPLGWGVFQSAVTSAPLFGIGDPPEETIITPYDTPPAE